MNIQQLTDRVGTSVLTVKEMREADAYTIAQGTPSRELMQRAARGVFDAYAPNWTGRRTAVLCGGGNNGGDGYALAVILQQCGCSVEVLRVSEKLSDDGAFYLAQCEERQIPIRFFDKGTDDLSNYDILVDCLLGTGFAGTPRKNIAEAICAINAAGNTGAYVVSVDINSGMNGDTGETEIAVKSDLTVSIGFYKKGFFCGCAGALIGTLVNVDIGLLLPG